MTTTILADDPRVALPRTLRVLAERVGDHIDFNDSNKVRRNALIELQQALGLMATNAKLWQNLRVAEFDAVIAKSAELGVKFSAAEVEAVHDASRAMDERNRRLAH